jgi:hypothetical protein
MRIFKEIQVILSLYIIVLVIAALIGAIYYHNRDLETPAKDFGVGSISYYFYIILLLGIFNTWLIPFLVYGFWILRKQSLGNDPPRFIKISRIALCTAYCIHFAILLGLHFESLDIFGSWQFFHGSSLTAIHVRSLLDVVIVLAISLLLFFLALNYFDRNTIARFRRLKAISLTLFGVYFCYLSGQNVITDYGRFQIEEYFSVFKIRTVLEHNQPCSNDFDNVEYKLTTSIFCARFTTNCDSISANVIGGIGPFLKLQSKSGNEYYSKSW